MKNWKYQNIHYICFRFHVFFSFSPILDAEGRTYLFDLDFNSGGSENVYTVDAANYGNVAHFVNHSCDPNIGKKHATV